MGCNSNHYGHRHHHWKGFPWMIPVFIIIFSHSITGFLVGIAIALGIYLLIHAIQSKSSYNSMYQEYQPYQRRQEQASYYQHDQPYQEGYQAPRQTEQSYQEGGRHYTYPKQEAYGEYEQPQAQYPEQMPPAQR
jgi:hypothetical protein